jgi:predicted nucleic acid-binding protein
LRRRYWDSDAFLGYFQEEPDKFPDCETVIKEAQAGRIEIATSALTVAEVLWLRGQARISADKAAKVELFFEHEWIVIYDLDRTLAERARRLVWDHNVKPKDAIHVATALDAGVEQLDTFDRDLHAKSGTIGNPPLVIGRPNLPQQLNLE